MHVFLVGNDGNSKCLFFLLPPYSLCPVEMPPVPGELYDVDGPLANVLLKGAVVPLEVVGGD